MSGVNKQAGFTLIELTLTMVISAALAILALMGFSTSRAAAQFHDSVERTTQVVLQTRTEADATVQLATTQNPTSAYTDPITIGRLLTFTPGSSDIQIKTLQTVNNPTDSTTTAVNEVASNSYTYTMPWGIVYNGTQQQDVVFYRSLTDPTAALNTAVSPPGGFPAGSGGVGTITYSRLQDAMIDILAIPLIDPKGTNKATINIDAVSNGVTRTYQ